MPKSVMMDPLAGAKGVWALMQLARRKMEDAGIETRELPGYLTNPKFLGDLVEANQPGQREKARESFKSDKEYKDYILSKQGMSDNLQDLMNSSVVDLGVPMGFAAGAIKPQVSFTRLKELLGGIDPTRLSKIEYGKVVKRLGDLRRTGKDPVSDIRNVWMELNGARAADKFRTTDPKEIIKRAYLDRKVPEHVHPTYGEFTAEGPLTREQAGSFGWFDPRPTPPHIEIIPRHFPEIRPNDPSLLKAGTAIHEAQHGIEDFLYPYFRSKKEVIGTGPNKDWFALQDFYSPERLDDFWKYIQKHPKSLTVPMAVRKKYPNMDDHEMLQALISNKDGDSLVKLMDQSYLTGQFGKDPYLAQRMKSVGHMKEFDAFEPEFSRASLAADNVALGGEVPQDLFEYPAVRDAYTNYVQRSMQSPGVPGQKAAFGKLKLALGLGAGGAGTAAVYGLKKLMDKDHDPGSEPESNEDIDQGFHKYKNLPPHLSKRLQEIVERFKQEEGIEED